MDAIRVPKVENVICAKAGQTARGTVHLTAHHLIFHYDDAEREEMWVPYPLISLVSRLPQTLHGKSPLSIRTRTFESFTLSFDDSDNASDVFDSVKELTVAGSIEQLYAFNYTPNPPLAANNGWTVYSPRDEFGRMGVGTRSKAWRFTDINKDYSLSPTYPARMVIPTRISDTTLQYAAKYRSKCRIPALTYLHWANYASITRCSQPMVGLTNNRSVQDEKCIEAIFHSHHSPESRVSAAPIYGATATNLIIDARPTTNAVANSAKGAGTENMEYYKEAKKAYLGIDNIHVVRDSLAKVVEALTQVEGIPVLSDLVEDGSIAPVLDREALRRSGWLKHISAIMQGTLLIVRNIHVNSSHVLVHCSDGWDRTAQLSSLAQLCLDPYYRTMRGFQVLIEKDWLSFGHRFLDRCGHLSSEKFFVAPVEPVGGGGAEAAQAFFASVQNRFVSQGHIKETSPVFHQFLECVRQIQRQFPQRFEFNERFLRRLHYHLYSCQFGTFLFNNERERRVAEDGGPQPCERTVSVWDFFNSPPELELNKNLDYDKTLDDPASRVPKADMGVLFPNVKDIRFWNELYGRSDEEMNGRIITAQAQGAEVLGPIERAADDPALPQASPSTPAVPSPSRSLTPLPSTAPVSVRSSTITEPGSRMLPPPSSTTPARSPSPASPSRQASKPYAQESMTTGMKSMWGRLSSNASAAFTAAQGAIGDVTRDFKVISLTGEQQAGEGGGELRSRELNSVGISPQGGSTSSSSSNTVGSSSNPWATVKAGTRMPSVLDNPWNTVRQEPPPRQVPAIRESMFAGGQDDWSLPHDPTVARPSPPATQPATRHIPRGTGLGSESAAWAQPTARTSELSSHREPAVDERPPSSTGGRISTAQAGPPAARDQSTDPLGVGPL